MTLRILSPAQRELAAIITRYEQERPGLGGEFADAFDAAVEEIKSHPDRRPDSSPKTRRYRMDRFEYSIHYAVEADAIVIAAVAHPSRNPGYWLDRL